LLRIAFGNQWWMIVLMHDGLGSVIARFRNAPFALTDNASSPILQSENSQLYHCQFHST